MLGTYHLVDPRPPRYSSHNISHALSSRLLVSAIESDGNRWFSETIATLPGGWDLAHAIRLGIKPFAELGANRPGKPRVSPCPSEPLSPRPYLALRTGRHGHWAGASKLKTLANRPRGREAGRVRYWDGKRDGYGKRDAGTGSGTGSGTGPILLSQATFVLAHIANSGPVPLSASLSQTTFVLAHIANSGPVPLSASPMLTIFGPPCEPRQFDSSVAAGKRRTVRESMRYTHGHNLS